MNLMFSWWWGVIAIILFVLYLTIEIPYYIPIIGLVVWFGWAFAATFFVTWVVNSSNEPERQQKNLNPYSAKNKDVFKTPEAPGKQAQAPPPAPVYTGNNWQQSKDDLKKILQLIGVSAVLFEELANRAVDFPTLLDGLCGLSYMNYHPSYQDPIDMESFLSRSKVPTGKAYIINCGVGGCYVGMAPFVSADDFVKKMSEWLGQSNKDYSIKLL